jgi:hypothetical protein
VVAFVFSFLLTVMLSLAIVPLARRRPIGTPLTWGQAMLGSVAVFGLLFLAYGVVPHQWLFWADNELKWRSDKLLFGPGAIFKPKAKGGHFPFTMNYLHIEHIVATMIYGFFLGMHVFVWTWWQKRGKSASTTDVAVSSYGRPLARKA